MSLIRIESFVNNNGGSTCTRCKYYVQIFTHSVLIKLVLPQAAQLGIHFFKCSHHKLRSKYTHRESVCMQARGCLHAIFSFTSAFTKLDHLSKQNIVCLYQCTQLSQLMWNPLCSNPCWVIIGFLQWHALSMCILRSLWLRCTSLRDLIFDKLCWNEEKLERKVRRSFFFTIPAHSVGFEPLSS